MAMPITDSTLWTSRAAPRPTSNRSRCRLTSEVERDLGKLTVHHLAESASEAAGRGRPQNQARTTEKKKGGKDAPGLWLSSLCGSALSLHVSLLLRCSCNSACLCVSALCFSGAVSLNFLNLYYVLLLWRSVGALVLFTAWNCNDNCGVRAHDLADWRLEPAP
jgi:hypothetical protein